MRLERGDELTSTSLADGSMAVLDTQRIGRMGELVVEFELLKRGWIVGNFNHTVMNSAGWDLFAAKGDRSVRIRVKAKRPGVDCFRWSAKTSGKIFPGLSGSPDDLVAAVSFATDGSYHVYLLPSQVVSDTLQAEDARWLAGQKTDGTPRKATTMRHIYMDERDDGRPSHGFAVKWAGYRDGWSLLG